MMTRTNRVMIGIVVLLIATACLGADWAQWRGPNRDGCSTETGLLKSWLEGGPKLLWKATGLGEGYSTVAVASDRIYTTGEKDRMTYVHALALDGGKILWSTKLGKAGPPAGAVSPARAARRRLMATCSMSWASTASCFV